MTHEDFIRLVRDMRDQQKRYFKASRTGNTAERTAALAESKRLETLVDVAIHLALNTNQATQETLSF